MITATRLKFCAASLAAIAMAACSGGYDYYEDGSAYGNSYRYGGAYDQSAYNMGGYGMSGGMASGMTGSNCLPGAGAYQYGGGYTGGGLRSGGRYGNNPVVATGNVEFYGQKSRYGSWEQGGASSAGCQTGGYWTIPTYQMVMPPPAVTTPAPAPVVTTIQATCPDGQYRMDNGDCAIMMTEETEQYVPPVSTHYPEVTVTPEEWYNPIRK